LLLEIVDGVTIKNGEFEDVNAETGSWSLLTKGYKIVKASKQSPDGGAVGTFVMFADSIGSNREFD
jgi:hypothetical protein